MTLGRVKPARSWAPPRSEMRSSGTYDCPGTGSRAAMYQSVSLRGVACRGQHRNRANPALVSLSTRRSKRPADLGIGTWEVVSVKLSVGLGNLSRSVALSVTLTVLLSACGAGPPPTSPPVAPTPTATAPAAATPSPTAPAPVDSEPTVGTIVPEAIFSANLTAVTFFFSYHPLSPF